MNIYESITAAMGEGYAIAKDSKNQQQGFKYRGIDAVMNVFQPILAKYRIFLVPEVLEQTREERQTAKGGTLIYTILKVRFTFYAEDGSNVSSVVIGEAMDSGDKGSNKAMSIAMKYAMFQIFCIPTEEMADPDAETPEPSKPVETPKCADCGAVITGYETNGKRVSAEKQISASRDKFGAPLCVGCCMKRSRS